MSITKPYTFSAGTKARANEVNANFDTLYSQVNTNISDIAQINRDIDLVDLTKADINGNSTQRFAVANPVNPTDGVNKQTLTKSLTNVLDFINGLTIEKDTNSPNDTILVNPGSCYDSTKQVILELSGITSKKNEGQGASTTYYVHIIGNDTGTSIDILISNSQLTPTLPTGYTKFRNIGSFVTDSSNRISIIKNYTNDINSIYKIILTYTNGDNGYVVWSNGYCEQWGSVYHGGGDATHQITFLKAFRNGNYSPSGSYTARQNAGDKGLNWSVSQRQPGYMNIFLQTSEFNSQACWLYWQAKGYLPEGSY